MGPSEGRNCPICGVANAADLRYCGCGADLARLGEDPEPTTAPGAVAEEGPCLGAQELGGCVLELASDAGRRFLVADGQTVGRRDNSSSAGRPDVELAGVPDEDAISRVHARFRCREGRWSVQHLGRTNFIRVNEDVYQGDDEVWLENEDRLELALTPFTIRISRPRT